VLELDELPHCRPALRLCEEFVARIWKEPHRAEGMNWARYETREKRREQAAKSPGLIPLQDVMVRVASFTFRFVSVEHLRDCLAYFQQKTHPTSRIAAKKLASQLGEDWRSQRSWEVERWFERLPMYLLEEPKREKVVQALAKALQLEESGKLKS
jgi:hypothetical protein